MDVSRFDIQAMVELRPESKLMQGRVHVEGYSSTSMCDVSELVGRFVQKASLTTPNCIYVSCLTCDDNIDHEG